MTAEAFGTLGDDELYVLYFVYNNKNCSNHKKIRLLVVVLEVRAETISLDKASQRCLDTKTVSGRNRRAG